MFLTRAENKQSEANIFFLLKKHKELLVELVRRELNEQFTGGLLGSIWVVFHPLFLMAVYLFVFSFVFRNKIGGTFALPLNYTTYFLSGLIPWLNLQQVLSKTCSSITANSGLVKQVIFPIELLPIKTTLSTLPSQLISMGVLFLYVLCSYHYLPWTYLLFPLVFAVQIFMSIGIAMLLSTLTAFIRDIKELVTLFCFAGMFLLPITYLPSWVPTLFKPLLYVNPFSYMIWCYQDIFYYGRMEHPYAWAIYVIFAVSMFWLGTRTFKKLKPHFGDVL
jgi:lipopolysaccharide transport system permease protein